MNLGERGASLMHSFEGKLARPYLCPAHMWTIGYGHVLYQEQIRLPMLIPAGKSTTDVPMIRKQFPLRPEHNRVWSNDEIDQLFRTDVASFERGVLRLAPRLYGRQGSFDACVAFAFNVGLGNFQRSTIRMKLNRDEWQDAADAFLQWTKAGGRELPGLVKRRKAERALFLAD
ncbi:MAG: hypothetical protein RL018_998 [Pseudomonadota bacterium]